MGGERLSRKAGSILRTRSAEESEEARELRRILAIRFAEVEGWHQDTVETPSVHPHSPLGTADLMSEPFQASHAVSYLKLTAVDHLHALRTLMKEARAQHIFAPYSLLRASLESAAAGLWILLRPDPRSIAVRSLSLEWANLRDLGKAHTTIRAPEEDMAPRLEVFDAVLAKNKLGREGIKANPVGSLKIIQAVCEAYGFGTSPVLMWQMCSGATHGRNWVRGFLTMMEAQDDGVSKIISGRLTSDEKAIVLALSAASELVRRLFKVQGIRAGAVGHSGAAFQKDKASLRFPSGGLYLPNRLRH
ncbi:hypothetical protein [Arthrobacter sp.]|uniref:hypothetical protein n=1 Tax=Arthrobacter sp. TaxID=1667 RepID=UPI003A8D8C6F